MVVLKGKIHRIRKQDEIIFIYLKIKNITQFVTIQRCQIGEPSFNRAIDELEEERNIIINGEYSSSPVGESEFLAQYYELGEWDGK